MYKNLQTTETKIENKSELYFLSHKLTTPLNISSKFESNLKTISVKSITVKRHIAYTGHFKNKSCDSECSKNSIEETGLLQYETEIKKAMKRIHQEIGL
ncbi:hypothetical protein Avbf_11876 [Armadillidium vulgare]|nr:hypothetical protein Avbf_11876 [Armadillidium vulgare]